MEAIYLAPAEVCQLAEGVSALECADDRLYVGTSTGVVSVYTVPEHGALWPKPTDYSVSRRGIEQIAALDATNQLALLTENHVSLWSANDRRPLRVPSSKGAKFIRTAHWTESQSLHTAPRRRPRESQAIGLRGMEQIAADQKSSRYETRSISMLVVATRKNLILYRWVDGVFWDQKQLLLPQAPVSMDIAPGAALFVGCSTENYIRIPIPAASSSSAASLPQRNLETGQTALVMGDWIDESDWPMFNVTLPETSQQEGWAWGNRMLRRARPMVQALDSNILLALDTKGILVDVSGSSRSKPQISWEVAPQLVVNATPYVALVSAAATSVEVRTRTTFRVVQAIEMEKNQEVKHIVHHNASMYAVVSSRQRTSLMSIIPRSWTEQLEQLESSGEFDEALDLLDAIPADQLPDVAKRRMQIQALVAVIRFEQQLYDQAMDLFIEIDTNPAKVLALYPAMISGKLAKDVSHWRQLFDAPPQVSSDADPRAKSTENIPRAALDALARFLTDRRRVLRPLVEKLSSQTSSQVEHSAETLLAIPSFSALDTLNEEQVALSAQVVDTALFKTLLHTKPSLVGALCRLDNWCEIREVKGLLEEHGMISELASLYQAKQMHRQALDLLQSRASDDHPESLHAIVDYVQKIGLDDTQLVLQTGQWMLNRDRELALKIFTDADHELPPEQFLEQFEKTDLEFCSAYLEHLLANGNQDAALHTKLALIYLKQSQNATSASYKALLKLLTSSSFYDAHKILRSLPRAPALSEARAELLGQLGQHEDALHMFTTQLGNAYAAELYCQRHDVPSDIWNRLLRWALDHQDRSTALALLSRQPKKFPLETTLTVLPKECSIADLRIYLCQALRNRVMNRDMNHVVEHLSEHALFNASSKLAAQQQKHVLVNESCTCIECQRRLGDAVVAVLPKSGKMLHYSCAHWAHQS
ncbi:Vacuolar morphogenesis protein 6 [Malassezia yamatoensis]|uniref:Vacuolar morphogenesis protein 6 n=1 Tax=Malassezia yamatoensis TaxID=253288 RepID=A0AAJ6CJ23_9BASI|nr:Vacuolar morphogenesis protein 6 [Malassezia yamatoensis]